MIYNKCSIKKIFLYVALYKSNENGNPKLLFETLKSFVDYL